MLKRAESHRCAVNTFGKLACNFGMFFKVSLKGFILENSLQNLNRVADFSQENAKNRSTCSLFNQVS